MLRYLVRVARERDLCVVVGPRERGRVVLADPRERVLVRRVDLYVPAERTHARTRTDDRRTAGATRARSRDDERTDAEDDHRGGARARAWWRGALAARRSRGTGGGREGLARSADLIIRRPRPVGRRPRGWGAGGARKRVGVVVGIARALLAAGVGSLAVALWKVDGAATKELAHGGAGATTTDGPAGVDDPRADAVGRPAARRRACRAAEVVLGIADPARDGDSRR